MPVSEIAAAPGIVVVVGSLPKTRGRRNPFSSSAAGGCGDLRTSLVSGLTSKVKNIAVKATELQQQHSLAMHGKRIGNLSKSPDPAEAPRGTSACLSVRSYVLS